jgi:hypothetical protein
MVSPCEMICNEVPPVGTEPSMCFTMAVGTLQLLLSAVHAHHRGRILRMLHKGGCRPVSALGSLHKVQQLNGHSASCSDVAPVKSSL